MPIPYKIKSAIGPSINNKWHHKYQCTKRLSLLKYPSLNGLRGLPIKIINKEAFN